MRYLLIFIICVFSTSSLYAIDWLMGGDMNIGIDRFMDWNVNMDWDIDDVMMGNMSLNSDEEIPKKITWKFTIGMFNEENVIDDIIVEGGELTIDPNTDVSKKIILNKGSLISKGMNDLWNIELSNATSLKLLSGVDVKNIIWTVWDIVIWANSNVEYLKSSILWNISLDVNSKIWKAYIKTKDFNMSANWNIDWWNIYVYWNLIGWANSDFKGKMTVFNNTNLDVNNDFNWRYCTLWRTEMWVNTDIVIHNYSGLFWNIDPITSYDIDDNSVDFNTIKEISVAFDTYYKKDFETIKYYNWKIYTSSANMKKQQKGNDKYNKYKKELDLLSSKKRSFKLQFKSKVNNTFDSLVKYIDKNENNVNLFSKVKFMYINAIDIEDQSIILQICNNSEVEWDFNFSFIKWNYIIKWDNKILRDNIIPEKYVAVLSDKLDTLSDVKLLSVDAKINKMVDQLMLSDWKDTTINTLLDLQSLLKNSYLY